MQSLLSQPNNYGSKSGLFCRCGYATDYEYPNRDFIGLTSFGLYIASPMSCVESYFSLEYVQNFEISSGAWPDFCHWAPVRLGSAESIKSDLENKNLPYRPKIEAKSIKSIQKISEHTLKIQCSRNVSQKFAYISNLRSEPTYLIGIASYNPTDPLKPKSPIFWKMQKQHREKLMVHLQFHNMAQTVCFGLISFILC